MLVPGFIADWSKSSIGYATSPDGITWTLDSLNNPVLTPGSAGQWDDGNLEFPHVLVIDSVYHMWYTGMRPSEGGTWQTGWATSDDGINWNKDNDPVLEPGSSDQWDGRHIVSGTFIIEGDSLLHMWYTGTSTPITEKLWRIGHAIINGLTGFFEIGDVAFPELFNLIQNYPNPFNPSTTFAFTLPRSEFTTLKIYNILGSEVATLVSDKLQAGRYNYKFDGSNLARGVYYYQVSAGDFRDVKKMILLR